MHNYDFKTCHIAVLGSTRGTHLTPLMQALEAEKIAAQVTLVVSDREEAGILKKAQDLHIDNVFLDPKNLTPEAFADALTVLLKAHAIDLILLVGFMRILAPHFIAAWPKKVLNVHPSLLPKYAGLMDLAVHEAVLASGERESGCSVHFVEEMVDAGEVIVQKRCDVLSTDTPDSLKAKVQALEVTALVEAIERLG